MRRYGARLWSRFPLLESRFLLPAVAEVAEEGFEPLFALRGGEGAVALYGEGLDAGEDVAVELGGFAGREVLEEGVESGGDGAVAEALRALQLEDFPKAVFGHGDGDQGRALSTVTQQGCALGSRSSVRDQRMRAGDRSQESELRLDMSTDMGADILGNISVSTSELWRFSRFKIGSKMAL